MLGNTGAARAAFPALAVHRGWVGQAMCRGTIWTRLSSGELPCESQTWLRPRLLATLPAASDLLWSAHRERLKGSLETNATRSA